MSGANLQAIEQIHEIRLCNGGQTQCGDNSATESDPFHMTMSPSLEIHLVSRPHLLVSANIRSEAVVLRKASLSTTAGDARRVCSRMLDH
jgi:hypothetical protein